MPQADSGQWRKAKRSAGDGACIEVAFINGNIAVRDSKNPFFGRLLFPAQSWRDFTGAVQSTGSD
jgi:hypothetical protein